MVGIDQQRNSRQRPTISRVDPLPHQLEAVYDYLLKLARVRFLLADDAGAGKTVMAGLLIRELKLRGLADRILIVGPANLAFQWQRELKDKFDEKFIVLKGSDVRDRFGVREPGPAPGAAPRPGPGAAWPVALSRVGARRLRGGAG